MPSHCGLAARGLVDDLVGALDGVAQDDGGAGQAGAGIGHGQVLQLDRLADQVGDGLHGDAAGDFAGVVAAHAVGKHNEAHVAVVGDGVLVVLANPARVAQADTEQLAFQAHQADFPLCAPNPQASYLTLALPALAKRLFRGPFVRICGLRRVLASAPGNRLDCPTRTDSDLGPKQHHLRL